MKKLRLWGGGKVTCPGSYSSSVAEERFLAFKPVLFLLFQCCARYGNQRVAWYRSESGGFLMFIIPYLVLLGVGYKTGAPNHS